MWRVFHPNSPNRWKNSAWFNAPTTENRHLPREYMEALTDAYEGRFFEQEVLGRFVGAIEGAVFPYWDPEVMVVPLPYRADLPLYTGWDFGYGDAGVMVFVQVEWKEKPRLPGEPGERVKLPWLYILDATDHKEWAARDWAGAYHQRLEEFQDGPMVTAGDYGDPAGQQHNAASGTSVIEDLNSAGVPVSPVQKRPVDYALRILNNMMAGGRVLVSEDANPRVAEALSHHHWNLDRDGVKIGNAPVHDWSSHFVDALRYFATAQLSYYGIGPDDVREEEYKPNQYGYVFQQMLQPPERKFGGGRMKRGRPRFVAPSATPRS
jgi:hypothetical protein